MNEKKLKRKIQTYIDANYPILYIQSFEENKIDSIIEEIKDKKHVLEWSEINHFCRFDTKAPLISPNLSLNDALDLMKKKYSIENQERKFRDEMENKILVLKDMAAYLSNPVIVSKLKSLALKISTGMDSVIIIVSSRLVIPEELEKFVAILDMDYPTQEEIKEKIVQFATQELNISNLSDDVVDEFSSAFKGLSEYEIEQLLALAYAGDGGLSKDDLNLIFEQKQQIIKKTGILEMVPQRDHLLDVGGLDILKEWLEKKAKVFKHINKAMRFGVDMPKGVLIAGIPGCGKSLSAKSVANLFEVPLLRLDMGRLLGKYVGESETNLRMAIKLAEAMSPCVLWVDELEKAFAGIGNEGGSGEVISRLLGNFLTWLQEKESQTFVVATANNITKLPPELLRKGRFDEIFYVDLPDEFEREKILEIHIQKRRKHDLKHIDLSKLAKKTKDFTGADIESVVKEAIETAFYENRKSLETEDFLDIIKYSSPLTDIMKEEIETMREEYKKRKFKNASK